MCVGGVQILIRRGVVSVGGARNLGVRGIATSNNFWFVANLVASKCLDSYAPVSALTLL